MALSPEQLSRWLEEARGGSQSALGHALEACREYLLHIALQEMDPQIRARAGASDLVQETFLVAQKHFERFVGRTPEHWMAWLRKILLNQVLHHARTHRDTAKRGTVHEALPVDELLKDGSAPADWTTPSGEVMAMERDEQLQKALARLPEHYRCLIQWRNQECLSFAVIGDRLGRSEEAAKQLWARALNRLRNELEQVDD